MYGKREILKGSGIVVQNVGFSIQNKPIYLFAARVLRHSCHLYEPYFPHHKMGWHRAPQGCRKNQGKAIWCSALSLACNVLSFGGLAVLVMGVALVVEIIVVSNTAWGESLNFYALDLLIFFFLSFFPPTPHGAEV